MKKQALKEDFNFKEVKNAADLLAEAKRKRNLLREPVSEDEAIAALGDAAGLWEFMFPGARHELLQLIVGDIVVYPDRISFVLKVDGLKDLASEMAVSGYFNEAHGDPAKLPETEQEILDDGSVRITMKMESKHIDGHRRVVIPAPGAERLKQTSLLRAINNARLWMDMLINGEAQNVTDLSKQLGLKNGYVTACCEVLFFRINTIPAFCFPLEAFIFQLIFLSCAAQVNRHRGKWNIVFHLPLFSACVTSPRRFRYANHSGYSGSRKCSHVQASISWNFFRKYSSRVSR